MRLRALLCNNVGYVRQNASIAVVDGKKINLQGFGTFESRERSGRQGRNPRTGEPIEIKATTVPAFSASKAFKEQERTARPKLFFLTGTRFPRGRSYVFGLFSAGGGGF